MISLEIPGIPIPYKAPGFRRLGKFVHTFNPREKEKEATRQVLKTGLISQIDAKPLDLLSNDYFDVACVFSLPIPLSCAKSSANAKLWHLETPVYKPDLDNLAKFYCDCLKGLVIPDDAQITSLHCKKIYAKIPKTVISIVGKKYMHDANTKILTAFSPDELTNFCNLAQIIHSTLSQLPYNPESLDTCVKSLKNISQYAKQLAKINKIDKIPMEGKPLC